MAVNALSSRVSSYILLDILYVVLILNAAESAAEHARRPSGQNTETAYRITSSGQDVKTAPSLLPSA